MVSSSAARAVLESRELPTILDQVSISGMRPASVFDVLQSRLRSGSHDDGNRLGLVVEGGAMRGVYSAGSLLGLHAMGASSAFDDVYATSAGAVNAAYFLSGKGELGADAYYRVLADGRFLDWKRPWKLVDIDFLVDEVFTRLRPMQVDAVLASRSRFWIAVDDFATSRTLLLSAQTAGYPLFALLKAAVALPIGYNRLVPLGPILGFDAGLSNPFPLRDAVAHGCTHILVLLSRAAGHRSKPYAPWRRMLFDWCFARGNRSLQQTLQNSWRVKNELRELATGHGAGVGGPAIATICPSESLIEDTTQDRIVLRDELLRCARGTVRTLALGEARLEEWIREERV
jgi:predicted patatin/cPLA2 family phospholipase